MEENLPTSENLATEHAEDGENVLDEINEQPSETLPESSNGESGEVEKSVITNPQATIKIEGQEFELEAELAQDDKLLKTILQPHFSSMENANLTREVKDGKLTVTIVKKAQPKGGNDYGSCKVSEKPFPIQV